MLQDGTEIQGSDCVLIKTKIINKHLKTKIINKHHECDVCPPPEGITKGWVPKTGSTINNDTGEDGDLQKGITWPIPRFTDNGDGTITDNLTCLIWTKDANCFGTRDWPTALSDCNSLASGSCGLSDGSVAGDWRLPNVRELHSLISYSLINPAVPDTTGTGKWSEGNPFTKIVNSIYWTSTTEPSSTEKAYRVDMAAPGGISANFKEGEPGSPNYVWCVRDGQ